MKDFTTHALCFFNEKLFLPKGFSSFFFISVCFLRKLVTRVLMMHTAMEEEAGELMMHTAMEEEEAGE